MFTGIIEGQAQVVKSPSDGVLSLTATEHFVSELSLGESVAINGCCLTVVSNVGNQFTFDLSEETLRRTSLGAVQVGQKVNYERAMLANGRFGGHIVQGHVDGLATLVGVEKQELSSIFRFQVEPKAAKYFIDKGSVTLDGISLTVVSPTDDGKFETWIIPHTLHMTNLCERQPGDVLNVEYDVLAKHVERILSFREA